MAVAFSKHYGIGIGDIMMLTQEIASLPGEERTACNVLASLSLIFSSIYSMATVAKLDRRRGTLCLKKI